jgi:carboxymethylenebutenolidase
LIAPSPLFFNSAKGNPMDGITPRVLTADQQTLLAAWQRHTYAEFVLKDADAALATMTEHPYVLMVATGIACVGRTAVHEYYANQFLSAIPPDLELGSLSQTIGSDRLVEEMVVRFTHTIEMDWLLPKLRPTGRRAEFIVAAVIRFENGKVAHEHIYWDQATLLSQMGVLDHPFAAGGTASVRQLSAVL